MVVGINGVGVRMGTKRGGCGHQWGGGQDGSKTGWLWASMGWGSGWEQNGVVVGINGVGVRMGAKRGGCGHQWGGGQDGSKTGWLWASMGWGSGWE